MQNKLFSVIIPIYNGETYIDRCVNSVLMQVGINVAQDIEILLLNDGSSDNSLKILRELEQKYPDVVKVISHTNMGVAKTRNAGIEAAKGTYIIFIDQDDFIDTDYVRTFYFAAKKGAYDIIVGGYKRPDREGKILRSVAQPDTEYSRKYKISAAWAKMHRTKFLKEHRICFYESALGEDIIFTLHQNMCTNKVAGINYLGYNWFWNEKSVSNTSQRRFESYDTVLNLLNQMLPFIHDDLDRYYLIQTGIYYLLFSARSATQSDFMHFYRTTFELFDRANIDVTGNKYVLLGPRGALLSVRFVISSFVLLHRMNLTSIFARLYCKG